MMIFSGLSQTYIFGEMAPLVNGKSNKFYVFSVFGACNAMGSLYLGRLSDRVGRMPVVMLGSFLFAAVIIFFLSWNVDGDKLGVFFVAAPMLGVGDAVFNTQIYAILGTYFEKHAESAFADYKLFQAGSTAIAFLYRVHLNFQAKSIITLTFLILGFLLLVYVSRRFPFDSKRRISPSPSAHKGVGSPGSNGSGNNSGANGGRESPSNMMENMMKEPDPRVPLIPQEHV